MKQIGFLWEILVALFLIFVLVMTLKAVLKSMDRKLDELLPSFPNDERGGGKRVPRRGTSKGVGDS